MAVDLLTSATAMFLWPCYAKNNSMTNDGSGNAGVLPPRRSAATRGSHAAGSRPQAGLDTWIKQVTPISRVQGTLAASCRSCFLSNN